jgi:hypothetical protein
MCPLCGPAYVPGVRHRSHLLMTVSLDTNSYVRPCTLLLPFSLRHVYTTAPHHVQSHPLPCCSPGWSDCLRQRRQRKEPAWPLSVSAGLGCHCSSAASAPPSAPPCCRRKRFVRAREAGRCCAPGVWTRPTLLITVCSGGCQHSGLPGADRADLAPDLGLRVCGCAMMQRRRARRPAKLTAAGQSGTGTAASRQGSAAAYRHGWRVRSPRRRMCASRVTGGVPARPRRAEPPRRETRAALIRELAAPPSRRTLTCSTLASLLLSHSVVSTTPSRRLSASGT